MCGKILLIVPWYGNESIINMDYVEQKITMFKKAIESKNFDFAATVLLDDLLMHNDFSMCNDFFALNCTLSQKRMVSEILNYVFISGEVSSLKRALSEKKT